MLSFDISVIFFSVVKLIFERFKKKFEKSKSCLTHLRLRKKQGSFFFHVLQKLNGVNHCEIFFPGFEKVFQKVFKTFEKKKKFFMCTKIPPILVQ